MKLTVGREALLAALDRARRVTPGAKESPTTAHARLIAVDGELAVYATDLTVFLACRIPAQVSVPGEIGVIPSALAEMVRRMPENVPISFAVAETRARLNAAGTKRSFALPVVETADMPAHKGPSPAGNVTVAGDALAAALKRVLPFAHQNFDRPNMCGVGFDGRASVMQLAATDGLRVVVADVPGVAGHGGSHLLHLAAARVVAAEASGMGNVGLVIDDRGFSFSSEGVDLFVPHVGAAPPAYNVAFENGVSHTRCTLDVAELTASAQAMAAVAGASVASKRTKLVIAKKSLLLSAQDEHQTVQDELDLDVKGPGGTLGRGFASWRRARSCSSRGGTVRGFARGGVRWRR